MLLAMQMVKNKDITLDVYSSCQVYGSEFAAIHNKDFQPLFNQAQSLPNVNYIGYKPNEFIKENITNYDLFVYPSIFEETFCVSALEALAAGIHVITTNFGALPETCSEWPTYINYTKNQDLMAESFAHAIDASAHYLHEEGMQNYLDEQQKFYKRFYSWERKGSEWTNFLTGAIHAKR